MWVLIISQPTKLNMVCPLFYFEKSFEHGVLLVAVVYPNQLVAEFCQGVIDPVQRVKLC